MSARRRKRTRRNIAVVTGTRAEYGLLKPLLRLLMNDARVNLQLVVCAAHLSPEFGLTKRHIVDDGFPIADEVEMLLSGDTPAAITKAVGLGCIGFADAFRRLEPDLLVLLGDRFEVLAAAQSALFARIPVAHLHGGELTEGAVDDSVRHAVTKMAHLHFVATERFRQRVIQLGEQPERVFTVGAIGLDTVRSMQKMTRHELRSRYGVPEGEPLFLVTYHPETLSGESPRRGLQALLGALETYPEAAIVMTYPNADAAGRELIREIEGFAARRARSLCVPSLGQPAYLSVLRLADAVVGNSSSGLIEAPSFGVPTVNIGDRQKGRTRTASVIDCGTSGAEIRRALARALSPGFRKAARSVVNPYGDGRTAPRIFRRLRDTPLEGIVVKSFHDIAAGPGSSGS